MTHDNLNPTSGKIEIGGDGLGTVTLEMVEQRALEIAKTDGRETANEADQLHALEELQDSTDPGMAPEVDERTESLVTWDDAPDESGSRAPTGRSEDDPTVAELLVEEGLEEADHDQRVSSANSTPPVEDEI